MLILFSGGGSMGSVSPLFALQKYIEQNHSNKNLEFFWLTSKSGPEINFFDQYNQDKPSRDKIKYKPIISARFKRGFNLTIFWQLAKLELAFWQSLFFLIKNRPDIIISTGSFVSPPTIWAAWFLRIPSLIHQQDIRPGLANNMMAPFVKKITVCFPETAKYFETKKTSIVGNPVRPEIKNVGTGLALASTRNQARKSFNLESNLPTLLVVSGSQGAVVINEVAIRALCDLLKLCQIIHITGKREIKLESRIKNQELIKRYHKFEFLTDTMVDALLVADLIVSRAGMNFLTEMSYLKKPALLIPVYDSHQEDNARYFEEKNACEVLSLKDRGGDIEQQTKQFIEKVKSLLQDENRLKELSQNISSVMPKDSMSKITEQIIHIIE